jgi:hypothetical protein
MTLKATRWHAHFTPECVPAWASRRRALVVPAGGRRLQTQKGIEADRETGVISDAFAREQHTGHER